MMFSGKNAFVTGTNRGIGKAIVEEFAKNGINVFAHARSSSPEFINFTKYLESKYDVFIKPVFFDITDYDATKKIIKEIFLSKLSIDILVNSAGVAHGGYFQMTPISKIKEVFDINLFAQMNLTQLILKIMTRQKLGSIINLASVLGINIKSGSCAYGVSKAAFVAWTKTLAAELGSVGIRVNAVAPGLVDTDMAKLMEKKAKNEMILSSAMNRMAKPQEIASVVVFLASDDSLFVNGQIISVDGGIGG